MGSRGPAPKDGPLHGYRTDNSEVTALTGEFPAGNEPSKGIPLAPDRWHAIARELYNATIESRQAKYYEPSDYLLLFTACEQLSRGLKPRYVATEVATGEPIYQITPLNGSELASLLKLFANLGMTMTDRRRIEVDVRQANTGPSKRAKREQEAVANLAAYREATRGSGSA